jgi:hypothetical protein
MIYDQVLIYIGLICAGFLMGALYGIMGMVHENNKWKNKK